MKFLLLLVFCFSSFAQIPDEKKSEPEEIRKDLRLICEISKMAQSLLNTTEFKSNRPVVASRVSQMILASIKTWEVKKTYTALTMADTKTRNKIWNQTAAAAGEKKWNCPTIGKI